MMGTGWAGLCATADLYLRNMRRPNQVRVKHRASDERRNHEKENHLKSRPLAGLSIRTAFENAGDALINRELVRLAASCADVVVDTSRAPVEFIQTLELDRIPNVRCVAGTGVMLRALIASRAKGRQCTYMMCPGGYHGNPSLTSLIRQFPGTLVLAALRAAGVRIALIGASYERLGSRALFSHRLRSHIMTWHLVRDTYSFKYCELNRILVSGVIPDLALNAPTEARHDVHLPPVITLSFRSDQSPLQGPRVLSGVSKLAHILPAAEWRVICQVERDYKFGDDVGRTVYEASGQVPTKHECTDIRKLPGLYAGSTYILSNRLHALILGILAGAEPWALIDREHAQKILGFMEDLGMGDHVLHLASLTQVDVQSGPGCNVGRSVPDIGHRRAQLHAQIRRLF